MSRTLGLIGAPSSAGAYAPGQENAPAAFRRHGLVAALERAGRPVHDRGDIAGFRWRPDPDRPKAMNLDAVQQAASAVADQVALCMAADQAALVLGGDCTIELGTLAGALRDGSSVALVYIDLDADLNPPADSDGALDWTGVAHMLDIPGAMPELSGLGPRRPMLAPNDLLLFGADILTPGETQIARELGLARMTLAEIQADPRGAAQSAVAWAAGHERLLVHFDADVLAFADFPIAENVRRGEGMTLEAAAAALAVLTAAPNWRALTITEVNPDHAPDEATAFGRLAAVLAEVLGR